MMGNGQVGWGLVGASSRRSGYVHLLCGAFAALGIVAVGSNSLDVRAAAAGLAQSAPAKSVWDGVYTDEQSTRGKTVSEATCQSCHGDELAGSDLAPALQGADFKSTWSGQTASDLFERIRTTMPANSPGSLTPRELSDVVAYILKLNEFPAGQSELAPDAAQLKEIGIRSQK
jgi:mono/diheme cytochrome c family protein